MCRGIWGFQVAGLVLKVFFEQSGIRQHLNHGMIFFVVFMDKAPLPKEFLGEIMALTCLKQAGGPTRETHKFL